MPNYRSHKSRSYDHYDHKNDDSGARDEGYHYKWCSECERVMENELGVCLTCRYNTAIRIHKRATTEERR